MLVAPLGSNLEPVPGLEFEFECNPDPEPEPEPEGPPSSCACLNGEGGTLSLPPLPVLTPVLTPKAGLGDPAGESTMLLIYRDASSGSEMRLSRDAFRLFAGVSGVSVLVLELELVVVGAGVFCGAVDEDAMLELALGLALSADRAGDNSALPLELELEVELETSRSRVGRFRGIAG